MSILFCLAQASICSLLVSELMPLMLAVAIRSFWELCIFQAHLVGSLVEWSFCNSLTVCLICVLVGVGLVALECVGVSWALPRLHFNSQVYIICSDGPRLLDWFSIVCT